MRLVRFGQPGEERPGLRRGDGSIVDVSHLVPDYTPEFFAADGLARLADVATDDGPLAGPLVGPGVRLGPPVSRPSKIVCVGHNYAGHIAEVGAEVPKEPTLFMKAPSALCGPTDDILIPPSSSSTDWEIEVAVIIGRRAEYLPDRGAAAAAIAGLALSNDVSERAFQLKHGGQWTKGKSFTSFYPLGPWLTTLDEFADPLDLEIGLEVGGSPMQRARTQDMVFDIFEIVRYVSNVMRLEPGDIISTGTPSGVGMGRDPRRFLTEGDIVTMWGDGLGEQRHECRQLPGA
jgi:2,4-diketo-3-deoxy-L-fuconate hydrolase